MSVQVNWVGVLPIASAIVALGSMLFSFRSSQIARNSLKLTQRAAQTAYETAKADPPPAVGMSIDEIQYRLADAPPVEEKPREQLNFFELVETRFKLEKLDGVAVDACLEVVVRGSLTNNTRHDILLTHKPYGRDWVNRDGECSVVFKRTNGRLLKPGSSDDFECIIGRSAVSWSSINSRLTLKRFMRRFDLSDVRRLVRWSDVVMLSIEYFFMRRYFTERCEFMFVCEPRFTERVATVWRVQIRQSPVLKEEAKSGEPKYSVLAGHLHGPFDDSILFYRGEFDSTLAQIKPSKFGPMPPGIER
ncbi:hypothetical protein SK803_04220 [Lentzea sp. BCCO 10_0856]|uniref:Uncharacterized protein n=1 Tax=Lentzea miocenica TaxID=3095431 RepID=A0ABU4SU27_9PSEU|nr:hypothetical protein [Lentzea sp. BCCO 10_0856]MDX8029400.1 hypothetical protein [Lentzea sp. BCCO 10_0856]